MKSNTISRMSKTTSKTHWYRLAAFAGLCLILGGLLPSGAHAQDPVPVSLPDVTGLEAGTSVEIPMTIDAPLTAAQAPILAYQVTVQYDPAVIDITGVTAEGTLTNDWADTGANTDDANSVTVAAFTSSSTALDEGESGTLVILEAEVLADGTSPLAFTDFVFNEGSPAAETTDGSVTVGSGEGGPDVGINEILYDPPSGPEGDANGDGTRDSGDDEFAEIVVSPDASASVDLSNWTLSDEVGTVHTFPGGTVLAPGVAVTVFGGGNPTGIPGLTQTATGNALNLNNTGDTLTLRDADGAVVSQIAWPSSSAPQVSDESIGRFPNFTGAFQPHSEIDGDDPDSDGDGVLFSPGQLNPADGPLPVEFADAPTPVVEGRDVVLKWTTFTEANNDGFFVEQRAAEAPAASFEAVSRLIESKAPGGISNKALDYAFRLTDLTPGSYVFRIRQRDLDGGLSFSQRTAVVEVGSAGTFALQPAFPNPLGAGSATLPFSADEGERVTVMLYNSLGQAVRSLEVREGPGGGEINVRAEGLPSGLYFVRLTAGDRTTTQPITLVQ